MSSVKENNGLLMKLLLHICVDSALLAPVSSDATDLITPTPEGTQTRTIRWFRGS